MMKFYYALLAMGIAASATAASHPAPRRAMLKAPHRSVTVQKPQVLEATDVTTEGFTANWGAVPGTETYSVMVYEPAVAPADGNYIILEETFNLVSEGSTVEPYFPEDSWVELSDYDWTYSPDWQGFWPVFAKGMVGGIIYSPYIALEHNNGVFTVNFGVVGYAGAQVRLTSYGTDIDEQIFTLEETGYNEFSATFTNGCHDTFLKFVDFGILDDPEGAYADCFDFLDEITVTQKLKKDEMALRLVATAETPRTSKSFAEMPYRYGATTLAYDVQANVVVYGPDYDDDPYDYEVYRSDYSDLQFVELTEEEDPNKPGEDDPNQPGENPEYPVGNDQVTFVGNYENPTSKDVEDGTWWDRTPFQWYTRYSGSQLIYTKDMLPGLTTGDLIKSVSFKLGDEGSFVSVEADLMAYIQNSNATEFVQKDDTDYYLWQEFSYDSKNVAEVEFADDLWYMQDMEITFEFDEPLIYNGESLVITTMSHNYGDEAQCLISYVMSTKTKNSMPFGDDNVDFNSVYATGKNYPYMTPNKWVPVAKFTFDRMAGVDKVNAAAAAATSATEYFNVQGQRVAEPTAPGIYVVRSANGVQKVAVK